MGSSDDTVDVVTVHSKWTNVPPFPEPLHWVMSAPVVELVGLQVGAPLAAEPMHWFTVAGLVEPAPVMLLTTLTLQITFDPPALTELLHWLIEITMSEDALVTGLPQIGASGAPAQVVVVTDELVTPVATSRLLTTLTSQRMSRAAPVSS